MIILLLILSTLSIGGVILCNSRQTLRLVWSCYFLVQCGIAVSLTGLIGQTELWFFTYDTLGVTYFVMMSILGLLCAWRSWRYLDSESLRHLKIYNGSLIALSVALAGVYLSNNLTVTWIFLEATTIATAGLIYHRRTVRSLEATWKYIFVSSVGIAIAYLGILMLSTVCSAHEEANLSYEYLRSAVAGGNVLYLKLAFLFILTGYTTKMELFPLFTVGIDANHAAPSPASSFISTAMVGGGFVALFRVYGVMSGNGEAFVWVRHVLLVVGLLSLLVAAVYMGRTTNYKRLFAYSTVENSALAVLGLGIGGVGIFAAVLHSLAHTVIKGVLFLQLSVVGKIYNTYKIGKVGDYFAIDRVGSLVLVFGFVGLVAMPPSLLFRSEFLMLTSLVASPARWLVIPIAFALLAILYWLCAKVLPIFYKPMDRHHIRASERDPILSWVMLACMLIVFSCGVVQIKPLSDMISTIVNNACQV